MNWNYILVEGFCAKDWEYNRKHSEFDYVSDDRLETFTQVKNPDYDPNIQKPDSPEFCQKKITSNCIKCPYLAYSDPEDEFQLLFDDLVADYIESSEPIDD